MSEFHIILFQPEIPPNTGNIIRLCANTNAKLSLIRPLGFALDDKRMRRAGLDYHEWARVQRYDSLEACLAANPYQRLFTCSTKATQSYTTVNYTASDVFLFGPETRGLPDSVLSQYGLDASIRIPMQPNSRSLNLSNAVAIILFEALRQTGFVSLR